MYRDGPKQEISGEKDWNLGTNGWNNEGVEVVIHSWVRKTPHHEMPIKGVTKSIV
jgi:hypothetical protein